MARDLYDVLGVARNASDDDIRKAYHKLARKHHPDRNPGDKQAEATFKEVQAAYAVLSDSAKRQQYDRFGTVGPQPQGAAGGPGGFSFNFDNVQGQSIDPEMLDEIFRHFGGGDPFTAPPRGTGRSGRRARPRMAEDIETEATIPFTVAALGGQVAVDIEGKELTVKVPAGVEDGKVLRLRGQAPGGGDLRLKLRVAPHPQFRREGQDVYLDVPLALVEAALGAKIEVTTLDGSTLIVKVPPGSSSGSKLRLRGKGITGGDQFLVFRVIAPAVTEGRAKELLEEFAQLVPQRVRE